MVDKIDMIIKSIFYTDADRPVYNNTFIDLTSCVKIMQVHETINFYLSSWRMGWARQLPPTETRPASLACKPSIATKTGFWTSSLELTGWSESWKELWRHRECWKVSLYLFTFHSVVSNCQRFSFYNVCCKENNLIGEYSFQKIYNVNFLKQTYCALMKPKKIWIGV